MAKRIPFEFVPSDVNTSSHPQIRPAGPLAELLFRRGNEHIKKTKRDGILFKFDLEVVGVGIEAELKTLGVLGKVDLAKLSKKLVKVGLWEDQGDRWFVPGYVRINQTQCEIAESKESKRLGALKTNHNRGRHPNPDPDCPLCEQEQAQQPLSL